MKTKNSRVASAVSMAAGTLLLIAATARAEIDWALFDSECPRGQTAVELACGGYGVFQVFDVVEPAQCTPVAGGREEPPAYPLPNELAAFPDDPTPVSVLNRAGPTPRPLLGHLPAWPAPAFVTPRIVAIDFTGPHGLSVQWLINAISGPQIDVELSLLDEGLPDLGQSVSDLTVLARLCEVAEQIDVSRQSPPLVVNMSFGRGVRANDPQADGVCTGDNLSCQIGSVVDYLFAKGVRFVAAAGNHRHRLFPANLPNVTAAGMLNVDRFMATGHVAPAWEAPQAFDGLLPANALCLRGGWPAPSGSSYASAILAGWLAEPLKQQVQVDAGGGIWAPAKSAEGCYVLSRAGGVYSSCNAEIERLFDGLAGSSAEECWSAQNETAIVSQVSQTPQRQPEQFPAVLWQPGSQAAPESDPCVPCVGGQSLLRADIANHFTVNLGKTKRLPPGQSMQAVHLRVGDWFYPILLDETELSWLTAGQIAALVLPGAAGVLSPGEPVSLFFTLREDSVQECPQGKLGQHDCAWTSTPVHILEGPGGAF